MLLSAEEHAEIRQAIHAAEQTTRGEIFCVVAEEAGDYREIPIAVGALAALALPSLLLLTGAVPADWRAAHLAAAEAELTSSALLMLAAQVAIFVVGAIIAGIPQVRRVLTPAGLKRARVRQRALEQFLAKNLHQTRERTGVLLYVALAERMVELLADEGIDARVEPGEWEKPVAKVVEGIARGSLKDGLISGVEVCGAVLAQHFPGSSADINELPDAVIELPRPK